MPPSSRETIGIALGLFGVCLFGGTLPATRLAVTSIDPLLLSAVRASIAGCAGLAVLAALRRPLPARKLWPDIAVAGLCTIVGFPVLMALAMAQVPAAHGGVVLGIMPLATAAAAALVTRERPSLGFWLASAAGAATVAVFALREGGGGFVLGDLYLAGTILAGAFGYAMSGRLSLAMPGWEAISWQVGAFLPLSVLASVLLWPVHFGAIGGAAWGGLAYVSLVSQFFAFFVFNAAMARIGVSRCGQLMLLQPFVIIALAVPVNGEPVRLETFAYAGAVLVAVVVGQRMRVRRR
jgi:drug/metabolite transporter (DMT)-like permease